MNAPGSLVLAAIELNGVKPDDRPSGAEDLFAFHQLRGILDSALQLKPLDMLTSLRADVDKRLYVGERWRLAPMAERVQFDRSDGPSRRVTDHITREQLRSAFSLQPGRYSLPEALKGTLMGPPKVKKLVVRMAGAKVGAAAGGAAGKERKRERPESVSMDPGTPGGSDTQDTGGGSRATALTARTAATTATGRAAGGKRQRSNKTAPS